MSRTSRIPYHQNVYDLFDVVRCEHLAQPAAEIAQWEQRNGRSFPAAMKEFYTTSVTLRLGGGESREWMLTLPELWYEFSNQDQALSVPAVFKPFTPRPWLETPALPTPNFEIIVENQGVFQMCARDDGDADPIVDVSRGYFFGPPDWGRDKDAWNALGSFTEVVFSWLASYYRKRFTPISYNGESLDPAFPPEHEPPKPYANGLWLRTPAEPFTPPVIDFLTEQLDEPERASRGGNVTAYTFRPPGGLIRVTADEPQLSGGLSAWWIHAETPERLAELARLVLPFGTLRETLRADTDPAREVLRAITS